VSTVNGVVDFHMKQDDLLPTMTITCLDDTTPVNLTTASSIAIKGKQGGTLVFSKAVTGNASGEVVLVWSGTDTATAGQLYVEVEVTWPGAKPQTFPASGYQLVQINADL